MTPARPTQTTMRPDRPDPSPYLRRPAAAAVDLRDVSLLDAARPPFSASTRMTSGVAVLTLEGRLDEQALPACRHAVEAAVRVRPARAVVDLNGVTLDDASVPLLRLIRRTLERHGMSMTLVAAAHEVLAWLDATGERSAYKVMPTVPLALGTAAAILPRQFSSR